MKMKFPSGANKARVCILIVNMMSSYFVIGQNPETELRLRKDLFANHSNVIRPVANISQPVEINATLELFAIFNFDTVNGILVTQCSLELSWYDEFLSWDSEKYANISMLYVSTTELWRPNIIVCNSVTEQSIDNKANNLVLHSDGRVVLWYQDLMRTFCKIDAHGYPFDKQHCKILIGAAIQKVQHTIIRQLSYRKASFFQNFEWNVDMEGIRESVDNSGRSLTKATLFLSRKIKISTIAAMIPSAIFTVVSVFVFLLPAESGEKVSLATTLLLSNIVYLVEIDKIAPRNSQSMPLITVYLLILTIWSGFNTIGAITECRIYIMQKMKEDMKNHSVSSDNKGVKAASKKNKANQVSDIDQDHNRNVETDIDDDVPRKDFGSNLVKENQPKNHVNYKQHETRHQRLSKIFFGLGVVYIIIAIITICSKAFIKEN